MENTCKNHPDRTAKRKCYSCHKYICSECQRIVSHHFFCSTKCHRKYVIQSFLDKFKKSLINFFKRIRSKFRAYNITPLRLILDVVLVAGLLICILLLRSVIREVGDLKGIRPVVVDLSQINGSIVIGGCDYCVLHWLICVWREFY